MKYYFIIHLLFLAYFNGYTQEYVRLHNNAIVVDTHNDILSNATMRGLNIENDLTGKTHSDLQRFKKGGIDVQVFAVWCDSTFGKDAAFKYANIEIDSLYAIANRHSDKMLVATTPADIKKAVSQKKLAAMIGVEGGHMIEDNMSHLDSFYKRGVRYLTLTWNNSTLWATSALDESNNRISNAQRGLNEFGKGVVRRMNVLGMMIDVSHVGDQTFWDVINTTTKPVIASHSSVAAITPHFRNLSDEQIKAIAKNRGVIQVNFSPGFLDSTYTSRRSAFSLAHKIEIDSLIKARITGMALGSYINQKYPDETNALRPSLSQLFEHIDHIVKLVGVDYVGLGSDFDGTINTPHDLEDVSKFPNITKGLLERGYSETDIKKVLGGNFLRVFKANAEQRAN